VNDVDEDVDDVDEDVEDGVDDDSSLNCTPFLLM